MNWDDNTPMTRRSFLLTVASAVIVSCTDSGRDAAPVSLHNSDWSKDALPKLVANYEAAAYFGRAYLDAHPEYKSTDLLMNDIERALLQHDASLTNSTHSGRVVTSVKQLIAKEFQRDEVALVLGWVLSVTEARLYALVVSEMDETVSK